MSLATVRNEFDVLQLELLEALMACRREKELQREEKKAVEGNPVTTDFVGLVGIMFLSATYIFTEGQNRSNRRTEQGRDIADFGDQSTFGGG